MEDLEDKLIELIKKDSEEKVIAINGKWGTGKSHFWKKFIKNKYFYSKAYISLYGINSLEEIENNILLQISDRKKITNLINKRLKPICNIDFHGISAKSILSIIEPKDFNELIICLDDFERLSENISINDLFGFIANLKENKKCKVVTILNEDRIKDNFKDDFNIQKEKIIDYELHFEPDFKYTKDSLEKNPNIKDEYIEYLYSFMKNKDVNNIRILNKILINLNDLSEKIDSYKNLNEEIKKKIFKQAIKISYVYHYFNFKEFNLLGSGKHWDGYIITDEKSTEKPILNYNNDIQLIKDFLGNFEINNLEKILIGFIVKHNFDENLFNKFIKDENYQLKNIILRKEFNELKDKYLFDFSYTLNEYQKDLFDFLSKNKKIVLKLTYLNTVKEEISKCYNSSYDYDNLLIEIQKNYLIDYAYVLYDGNINHDTNLEQIMKEGNEQVMIYYNELFTIYEKPTFNEIISIFEKVINTQKKLNKKEITIVNKLSIENIKEFIINKPEFVKILPTNYNRHTTFSKFNENLKRALKELAEKEKYEDKIKNLEKLIF